MSQKLKPLSEVTALVVDNGLFVELAEQLSKSFKKVYYHVPWASGFPKMNNAYIGYGLNVETVLDIFGPHFDDIDLFIFPDVYSGPLQLHLESLGKIVWGARMGEEMELERDAMKQAMAKDGLPVAKWRKVHGTQELRDYLKENKNKWVKINRWRGTFETFFAKDYKSIEPKLDEVEQQLGAFKYLTDFIVEDDLPDRVEIGIDSYTVDGQLPSCILTGIEIKDCGLLGVFKDFKDIPKPVRLFDEWAQKLFKAYGYRGFYSTEVRIGKDHQPYMIDACFSDDTEVLTGRGWRLFRDCDDSDTYATLNTASGRIEYQMASRRIAQQFTGEMVLISNQKRTIECIVTPDHRVLRTDRFKSSIFTQEASKLTDKGFIPRTGKWIPESASDFFTLPEYSHSWDFVGQYGHHICKKTKKIHEVRIPMVDWSRFMGWFLSEGSTSGGSGVRRHVVNISQVKHCDEVIACLDRLPFKYRYKRGSFRICSTQLGQYLRQFGLCNQKYVPDYIKQSSLESINAFLDAYQMGDGSCRKGRGRVISTTSKQMADDLQELIFKSGSVATISRRKTAGTKMSGFGYTRRHDQYIVSESPKFRDFWFETQCRGNRYIQKVPYSGMTYCVTVPNSTIYVRRNGKPFWSGNCARAASPPSELYQEFYTNLAEIIWKGANGILVDPNPIAKYGAEALIHSAWADKNWQPIDFPEKYRRNIKLRNAIKINGRYYVVPQNVGLPEIGAVIGWGDTIEEAINMVKEISETVSGYFIQIKCDAFETAQEEIKKLKDFGASPFD